MLVITGMGRSGTSALAALCKSLNFDPGGAYVEGINAGLEDPDVVAINEEILGPAPDNEPVGKGTFGRIGSLRRPVIKDPRFILARGTALQVWWEQRQDLRVLLTVRDPEEVVRSRRAHPHWFGPTTDESARTLEWDIDATLGLLKDRGIPFRCLRFPDFLKQPDRVFEALRFGGLSFPDCLASEQWERLIDPSKVRHSPEWEGSPEPPPGQLGGVRESCGAGRSVERGPILKLRKVAAGLWRTVSRRV